MKTRSQTKENSRDDATKSRIQTRSKTRETILANMRSKNKNTELYKENRYNNEIDFDESSRLWNQNKKYLGNGTYIYIYEIEK